MELATCPHCQVEFNPIGKHPRKTYCSKKCQQNAQFRRNSAYYKARYEAQKQRILGICREYRKRPEVQEMRSGYYLKYKPKDQANRANRYRMESWYRERNRSRGRAREKLRKLIPDRICCHCSGTKRVICHHVDENPLNNSSANLCWLCSQCHGILHSIILGPHKDGINKSITRFQQEVEAIQKIRSIQDCLHETPTS